MTDEQIIKLAVDHGVNMYPPLRSFLTTDDEGRMMAVHRKSDRLHYAGEKVLAFAKSLIREVSGG